MSKMDYPSCPAVTSRDMHPCERGAEWNSELTDWGSATDDDVLPCLSCYDPDGYPPLCDPLNPVK